jgi:hypothetical protein
LLAKQCVNSIIFERLSFIERRETPARLPKGVAMLPQPPEFLDLFSTDHRRRETVAAAERLRRPVSFRTHAAALLRGLADRLSPVSAPPRTTSSPAAASRPRPASSRCDPVS